MGHCTLSLCNLHQRLRYPIPLLHPPQPLYLWGIYIVSRLGRWGGRRLSRGSPSSPLTFQDKPFSSAVMACCCTANLSCSLPSTSSNLFCSSSALASARCALSSATRSLSSCLSHTLLRIFLTDTFSSDPSSEEMERRSHSA